MTTIPYGSRVSSSSIMVKRARTVSHYHSFSRYYTSWVIGKGRVDNGVYLGTRTVKSGHVFYDDDGPHFEPKKYKKVALVSPGPNRNPIYVSLNQLVMEEVK